MKKFLLYTLIFSISSIGFYACNEDEDDEQLVPQNNTPIPGSGNGGGTGGGTGSGGIPPNSIEITVDGNVLEFDSVIASLNGNDISITGIENSSYPRLIISLTDTLSSDTFFFPAQQGQVNLNYQIDSTTTYNAISGYLYLRNIDSSRSLANGRFQATMLNLNNAADSIELTKGQFNKFYN